MSKHWSNRNEEPRPLKGRFAAEVEQGLRCRHERRWEDNCASCGRAGGQPPGVLLLGLSDEVASLQCQLTTRADEYATELEDLQTRMGEMDVDLAAAEADKEHLAKYLAERNREVAELKAEVLALRRECVATGDAAEAAVQAAKRMKAQRDELEAQLEEHEDGLRAWADETTAAVAAEREASRMRPKRILVAVQPHLHSPGLARRTRIVWLIRRRTP